MFTATEIRDEILDAAHHRGVSPQDVAPDPASVLEAIYHESDPSLGQLNAAVEGIALARAARPLPTVVGASYDARWTFNPADVPSFNDQYGETADSLEVHDAQLHARS